MCTCRYSPEPKAIEILDLSAMSIRKYYWTNTKYRRSENFCVKNILCVNFFLALNFGS